MRKKWERLISPTFAAISELLPEKRSLSVSHLCLNVSLFQYVKENFYANTLFKSSSQNLPHKSTCKPSSLFHKERELILPLRLMMNITFIASSAPWPSRRRWMDEECPLAEAAWHLMIREEHLGKKDASIWPSFFEDGFEKTSLFPLGRKGKSLMDEYCTGDWDAYDETSGRQNSSPERNRTCSSRGWSPERSYG